MTIETPSVNTSTSGSSSISPVRDVKRPTNVVSMSIVSHAKAMPITPPTDGEQRAFGEQLAHQPAAAGAERGAHRQLAIAAQHPRQREVGDVRARDQQHQAGDAEQDQQQLARAGGQRFAHRHASWRGSPMSPADRPGLLSFVKLWQIAPTALAACSARHARLQAAEHVQRAERAAVLRDAAVRAAARNGHASTGM